MLEFVIFVILLVVKKNGSQKSKMNFIYFIILFKVSKEFRIRIIYEYWLQEFHVSYGLK